jgi:predicted extracellular nuclease
MPTETTLSSTLTPTAVPKVANYNIQSSGLERRPFDEQVVVAEGSIIAGVFTGSDRHLGFFTMQDATGDGDSSTSNAIFAFTGGSDPGLSVGDCVRVTGEVSERFGLMHQMAGFDRESCVSPGAITAVALTADVFNETYEHHMLVTFTNDLLIVKVFQLARFGEIRLSSSGSFYQPTNVFLPGSPEAVALANRIAAHTVVLDDDNNSQNQYPKPYVAPGEPCCLGDSVLGLTGVVDFSFGVHKIRPTRTIMWVDSSCEPAPKDVNGVIKIGASNVLNYFNGDGLGAGGFPTPLGANNLTEFDRQKTKIVEAIVQSQKHHSRYC